MRNMAGGKGRQLGRGGGKSAKTAASSGRRSGISFFLPFYVYAYSFADCLVNSLYQVSREGKVENFPAKYLEMLSKTAITDYGELLAPFGLNPNDPEFWNEGLSLISGYIDELERLDAKLQF